MLRLYILARFFEEGFLSRPCTSLCLLSRISTVDLNV